MQSEIAEGEAMKLTALDQGYFVVSVNNVDVSQHTTEREAIERAANLELTEPSSVVEYRHDYRVKVEAEASSPSAVAAPTAPAPVPGADVLFQWDATQVAPFGIQAKDPSRVTLVNVGGRPWARLLTMPGDTGIAGSGTSERCDFQLSQQLSGGFEGRDEWWEHEIMFPSDYVDPPESTATSWNFGVVANFHNSAPGAGQANFQVQTMPVTAIAADRPTGLSFQIAYGSQASPTKKVHPIGPLVRNVPYVFRYHVRWSSGADGFFDAWVNGVQKMSYKGPTLYSGQGVYLKLANYHTAHGKPSAVLHGRVVIARTQAALA